MLRVLRNKALEELDAIVDLGKSDSTQNLIRNFFLAEKYKKGTSKWAQEKIVHAAVIGAGVMGSGIAQWLSSRGVTVILRDIAREQLNSGLANVIENARDKKDQYACDQRDQRLNYENVKCHRQIP